MKRIGKIVVAVFLTGAISLLLAACGAKRSASEIIEELAVYYGTYGEKADRKVQDLLKELRLVSTDEAIRWEKIMELWQTLSALVGRGMSPLMLLAGDALAKWFASTMLYFLPYARNAAEAKNRLVYVRTPWSERLMSLLLGVAPMALVWREASVAGVVMAAAALWLMVTWMRRRLAGYTGDCCGATFLVVELVFYVTLLLERCMR